MTVRRPSGGSSTSRRITETMDYQVEPSAITTYTLAENETTFRDSQDRAGELDSADGACSR